MAENNNKPDKYSIPRKYTVRGLYYGVIAGAAVMMVAGGLGYTKIADLSLIMGISAGPSFGWLAYKISQKKEKSQNREEVGPEDE